SILTLTIVPQHRKDPLRSAEIATTETACAKYHKVRGTRRQYLIGNARARYFEVKTAQRLIFHSRSRCRPNGFKACEKIWKGLPDHFDKGANGAHHHKAVPKAATAHQVQGDQSGRLFPAAAYRGNKGVRRT